MPDGTISPVVQLLVGFTLKVPDEQITSVLSSICGVGFTVIVKSKVSPLQSLEVGVTEIFMLPVKLHELINVHDGIEEAVCSPVGKPVIQSEVVASQV